tara:strand:+ start:321 stop:521 length:201 start_codon:yes stop_codon:yes gene_type:complete
MSDKNNSLEISDNATKLEDVEEFVWRWKNHKKMLDIIYKSNIDTEIVKRWEAQIDECFREKIKSNL